MKSCEIEKKISKAQIDFAFFFIKIRQFLGYNIELRQQKYVDYRTTKL